MNEELMQEGNMEAPVDSTEDLSVDEAAAALGFSTTLADKLILPQEEATESPEEEAVETEVEEEPETPEEPEEKFDAESFKKEIMEEVKKEIGGIKEAIADALNDE